MQLNIRKLVLIISVNLAFVNSAFASDSMLKKDIASISKLELIGNPLFDNNPWGIDFSNGRSVSLYLMERLKYVNFSESQPALCYNDKSSKMDDLLVNGSRVSSCSSPTLRTESNIKLDVMADPDGYISHLRGKDALGSLGFGGGYVVNEYEYVPFKDVDDGIFWYQNKELPSSISTKKGALFYRVAHYLGDSMLPDQTLGICESIVPSRSFVCDGRDDSVFALKGIALLSFASSCTDCDRKERLYLMGDGISYLMAIPKQSMYSVIGFKAYGDLRNQLIESGYDLTEIENKKIYRLIN